MLAFVEIYLGRPFTAGMLAHLADKPHSVNRVCTMSEGITRPKFYLKLNTVNLLKANVKYTIPSNPLP